MNLEMRLRDERWAPTYHTSTSSELPNLAELRDLQGLLQSVKRLQKISVGLDQAQSLQEGVRGAESPGLQPWGTLVFSTVS